MSRWMCEVTKLHTKRKNQSDNESGGNLKECPERRPRSYGYVTRRRDDYVGWRRVGMEGEER